MCGSSAAAACYSCTKTAVGEITSCLRIILPRQACLPSEDTMQSLSSLGLVTGEFTLRETMTTVDGGNVYYDDDQ